MELRIGRGIKPVNPRSFIPDDADLGDPEVVESLFDKLAGLALEGREGLESWLLKWSELASAIQEEEATRYIRMTLQTDDEDREKDFMHFVENISPRIKPRQHQMAKKFLESPFVAELDPDRYGVLIRDLKNEVSLFREENVALQTEDEKLSQSYQKTIAAMTIEWEGEEITLQRAAKYLEVTDREVRRSVWERITERRLKDAEKLDDLYDEMIRIRTRIAQNAGFENFRDYAFKARGRFDYGVSDCENFHAAIKEVVVPLYREREELRRKRMGLDKLRPWDLQPDPLGRPPLQPFEKVGELLDGCGRIFDELDPALGERFKYMADHELIELESRKGKAPGAYSHSLEETRVPFIFQSAVGRDSDVNTLLHESGHSFHTLESRDEPLVFYRHAPIEFAEVASMSMEFLGSDHLEVFYGEEDALRSREQHLESVIWIFCWIAAVDAFQHWVYTHPGRGREERAAEWTRLRDEFGGVEDWSGHEEARKREWHRQIHIFEIPFYYVEYGIAELGALQIWVRAMDDKKTALQDYRRALSLGGSRPLPDLFRAAGVRFDMTAETLAPLMARVRKKLDETG